MLVKTYCAAMMGLEATTITIEVNMTRGMMFHLSGLADTAVKEVILHGGLADRQLGLYIPGENLLKYLRCSGQRTISCICPRNCLARRGRERRNKMKAVIAIDSFKGSLSSLELALKYKEC